MWPLKTQVIPVVIGASEVINRRTFLAFFGSSLCIFTSGSALMRLNIIMVPHNFRDFEVKNAT